VDAKITLGGYILISKSSFQLTFLVLTLRNPSRSLQVTHKLISTEQIARYLHANLGMADLKSEDNLSD